MAQINPRYFGSKGQGAQNTNSFIQDIIQVQPNDVAVVNGHPIRNTHAPAVYKIYLKLGTNTSIDVYSTIDRIEQVTDLTATAQCLWFKEANIVSALGKVELNAPCTGIMIVFNGASGAGGVAQIAMV